MTTEDPTNKRAEGGRESEMTQTQLSKKLDDLQKLPDLLAQLVEAKRLMGEDGLDKATAEARNYKFNELYSSYNRIAGRDPDLDEAEKEGGAEKEIGKSLLRFFEEESEIVPAVELSDGGNNKRNALKTFPDGRILMREVSANYDIDEESCRFLDAKHAVGELDRSVKVDSEEIAKLSARRDQVEALRKKLESGKSKK